MRIPRLFVFVLFLLLGLALSACSHGRAKDIAQALADRLTDAMSIDGATKEEGTAPSPDFTPGRPVISDVQLPETLYADAPLTITLTSTTVESGKIVGVVLLVPNASHYMAASTEVSVEAGQSVIRLKGHMNEADLNGEFSFMFALKGTDGRVGAYTEKRFRIGREAKVCSDEPCCNGGVWQAEGQDRKSVV